MNWNLLFMNKINARDFSRVSLILFSYFLAFLILEVSLKFYCNNLKLYFSMLLLLQYQLIQFLHQDKFLD